MRLLPRILTGDWDDDDTRGASNTGYIPVRTNPAPSEARGKQYIFVSDQGGKPDSEKLFLGLF